MATDEDALRGRPTSQSFDTVYPSALRSKEAELIMQRRTAAGILPTGEPPIATPTRGIGTPEPAGNRSSALPSDCVGFALSGGGIRSATFCLGVFQALARLQWRPRPSRPGEEEAPPARLLHGVDFISTVSGGGYFGGFLGRLFTRDWVRDGDPRKSAADGAAAVLSDPTSRSNRWLRENGRFLAPNGAGDALLAGAVYLRNLASIHVVLAFLLLTLFLAMNLLRLGLAEALCREWPVPGVWLFQGGPGTLSDGAYLWVSPWLLLALPVFMVVAVPLGWAYWFTQPQTSRSFGGATAAIGFGAAAGTVLLIAALEDLASVFVVVMLLGCLAPLLSSFWFRWVVNRGLKSQPTLVAALVVALLSAGSAAVVWFDQDARRAVLDGYVPWIFLYILGAAFLALAWWGLLAGLSYSRLKREDIAAVRCQVSAALKWVLITTVVLLLLGVIDSLGQTAYAATAAAGFVNTLKDPLVLPPLAGLIALIAGIKRVALWLASLVPGQKPRLRWEMLAGLTACAVAVAYLTVVSMFAHGFLWSWYTPKGDPAGHLRGLSAATQAARPSPPSGQVTMNVIAVGGLTQVGSEGSTSPADEAALAHRHLANPEGERETPLVCLLAMLMAATLTVLFGRTFTFLNLSSHHGLYSARLARAYLGASNETRLLGLPGASVTDAIIGDDTPLCQYTPSEFGGPLHLVNVTVNKTVSGRSNLERRDRKGLPLAVGPAGMSVWTGDHALWAPLGSVKQWSELLRKALPKVPTYVARSADYLQDRLPGGARQCGTVYLDRGRAIQTIRARECNALEIGHTDTHPVEELSLAQWLGASGAAFTTGLGAKTSLGFSLLLGLLNVRLGYWWDSGVSPRERPSQQGPNDAAQPSPRPGQAAALRRAFSAALPVQSYLFNELLARFHGSHRRHWYLSDGGHFENTGCYELIRRQVPVIICCDCGADPAYQFADVANLVRKARTDFGAEIEFLSKAAHAPGDAALDSLRTQGANDQGKRGYSPTHCVIATVRYAGRRTVGSVILFLKPTLTGDEPEDILHYSTTHGAFPQETTADQFFDEAQWESYRKLGEHIAEKVFTTEGFGLDDLVDLLQRSQGQTPGPQA